MNVDYNDKTRIQELNLGKCPFFEPGMDELLSKHLNITKLLTFSSSLADSIKDADLDLSISKGPVSINTFLHFLSERYCARLSVSIRSLGMV